jgi:hypothetical protein
MSLHQDSGSINPLNGLEFTSQPRINFDLKKIGRISLGKNFDFKIGIKG